MSEKQRIRCEYDDDICPRCGLSYCEIKDLRTDLAAANAEIERLTGEVESLSADRFHDQKAHENRLEQWRLDNEN